ncbi:hypothetical protein HDR61_04165 [bacterium]|nr:hypothetical protein [bacterium]
MHSLLKMFGASLMGLGFCGLVGTAYGAAPAGRAGYGNVADAARAGMTGSMRMPTMPTMSINTVGNMSPNLPGGGGTVAPSNPGGGDKCPDGATGTYPNCVCPDDRIYNPKANTCDACEYAGQVVINGVCECPDGMTLDVAAKSCVAAPECPDGGVKNSEYTVTNCMNDIYSCVNNGGLPNGINDLFNEDLRNSIENGMALCSVQVERCLTDVRRDCKRIYRAAADVWIDFNTRKVQPEYYNFVLRKTGLTPNQAENTCLLLDRNTYGPSFAAVATNGNTTAEYNNRVGAYNGQMGNVLIKNNPQGVTVNSGHAGVDGARGHYARWDAATADCYIRVAAYNKDKQIKNSWLFGAAGNDQPAEAWQLAGQTFTCGKDLFGFNLMNDTRTTAVVGVGGGTLVGAGVGALAGHGARDFDCSNDGHRKQMLDQLKKSGQIAILNEYLLMPIDASASDISISECRDIAELYQTYTQAQAAITDCTGDSKYTVNGARVNITEKVNIKCGIAGNANDEEMKQLIKECEAKVQECLDNPGTEGCKNITGVNETNFDISDVLQEAQRQIENGGGCRFRHIKQSLGTGLQCNSASGDCISADELKKEVLRLGSVLGNIEILKGEKNNRVKTTLIGAGVGAGAGGIATGIAALIEHNNINCRVGDGLAQVAYGKSYNIETLKDFYVKWNLQLPDTISPTGLANDCNSWRALCGALTDEKSCNNAQINYRGPDDKTITLIRSACKMSGSQCIENYSVAKSYGACE